MHNYRAFRTSQCLPQSAASSPSVSCVSTRVCDTQQCGSMMVFKQDISKLSVEQQNKALKAMFRQSWIRHPNYVEIANAECEDGFV